LGWALPNTPTEEKILAGLFLCSREPNEILRQLKPALDLEVTKPFWEKCSMLNAQQSILNVFPWKVELSDGIEYDQFCESFFTQPDLFLRLRPGYESSVKEKLLKSGVHFSEMGAACLSMSNSTRSETIIGIDKEAVIQDYNSQRTGDAFKIALGHLLSHATVWDCCAGSGGKSLLLYDIQPGVDLTVSDIRQSILINLKKRFERAGIRKYRSFIVDLTNDKIEGTRYKAQGTRARAEVARNELPTANNQQPTASLFDLIICDAPCTGSGTWSRTPEQLYYFDEKRISEYASLQRRIVSNILPSLKPGGFLVYVTCSVFRKENEELVNHITEALHLKLIQQQLLRGYEQKADTMFTALFQKS
jgi:16S rRNA (cytosine967-C5)-methyltransferase